MIEFDAYIYEDVLNLLLSDKTNIREEINNSLRYDDREIDDILYSLKRLAEDKGLDIEKVETILLENTPVDTLMEYINFNENAICLDYAETAEAGDYQVAVFRVPCIFDGERFLRENVK